MSTAAKPIISDALGRGGLPLLLLRLVSLTALLALLVRGPEGRRTILGE
jgi:hypothetical protein